MSRDETTANHSRGRTGRRTDIRVAVRLIVRDLDVVPLGVVKARHPRATDQPGRRCSTSIAKSESRANSKGAQQHRVPDGLGRSGRRARSGGSSGPAARDSSWGPSGRVAKRPGIGREEHAGTHAVDACGLPRPRLSLRLRLRARRGSPAGPPAPGPSESGPGKQAHSQSAADCSVRPARTSRRTTTP